MNLTIDPQKISVRDLAESDVPFVLDYWFRSPAGFVEGMGVDLRKMPTEAEMKAGLTARIQENEKLASSKLSAVAITYDGRPIGIHTIFPVTEGDFGIFHAHIFDPEFRRRGVGLLSYPKACRVFFERFNLKKILFKTPLQNGGAIRVKEKLGIRVVGEETIGFGIIKEGTRAKVFELTREEAIQKWS